MGAEGLEGRESRSQLGGDDGFGAVVVEGLVGCGLRSRWAGGGGVSEVGVKRLLG